MLSSRIRLQNRLFTLIQNQYIKHFGNRISQDFDQQVESQFRQALSSRSANFQEAILSKLGKTRTIREFIKLLKDSKEFIQSIETSEEKQIHSIPQKSIVLGKNTNFIFSFPLSSDLQWSLNTIVNQTGSFEKEYIQKIINQSNNFIDFIQAIDDYFLDYCIRKLDSTQIVSNFNRISLDAKIKSQEFKEILDELTCIDFIRLYALFYIEREYFGYILSKLGLPLPILFTTKLGKQKKQYYLPQLLSSITRQNNYCLITCVGTSKTKTKGKTSFLQKLFLLKKKSLSSSACSFHQGSVDFYPKIPLKMMDKDIIIADFHGSCSQNPKYNELLRKCIQQSSVVFINANEKEINLQNFQQSLLLSQIKPIRQCINSEALNFIILRDSQRYDDVINGKTDIFQIVKLPNLEDSQKQPVVQSRCEYIFGMIKKHNYTAQKLKMSAFYNELALQKFLNDEGYVQKVMKILLSTFKNNNQGFYATLFPNLERQLKMQNVKEKLTTIELKLKIQIQQQSRALLILYNKTLQEYETLQREKIPELSEMSLQAIGILQEDFKRIYLLSDVLFKWKQRETDVILKMIINKNAEYANLNRVQGKSQQKQILKQIIKNAQTALQKYDISVDTIFSQLISSLQNRDVLNNPLQAKLIRKYYQQSYRNLNPINLIQGKTLSFGNYFLQQFMKQLQKTKYSNRQLFVVSVIGAQSSAKSTILNYLFRCNFATSVGRCTKGVYFTIVQCGQRVIVVIDTQGLLSVAARDHAFDVQIASFVMLISDLVIINNRGEVNAVLRDLLGVCIYAIDQLNSTQQAVDYQPNKVIFTIRDQVEYGGTKQHQMLGAIIKNLNQQSKVDFRRYIEFTQKDIYPLQSAFVSLNEGNICYQSANNSFGKSIIALRARILSILKKPKNQSLTQFYSNAKRRWLSIKNCGENIFNFKNIYEIKTTQLIKDIFQKLKKQVRISFLEKHTFILEAFKVENIVQKENQIRQSLKNNFFRFKKETIDIFNSRCEEKVSQKELIKKFHFQIQQFCTLLYSDSVQKFNRLLQQKRFEKENIDFRKNISKALKQSNSNGKTDEQIINEYRFEHRNMIQKISKQLSVLQSKQINMGRNQISLIISNKIQQFLRGYYYANKINYMNLQMLKKQYMAIQRLRADKQFSLVQHFIIRGKAGRQGDIMHSDRQMMVLLVNNFLKSSEETINRIITQDFKANLEEMESDIIKIIEEIDESYNQLGSNLQKIGRNFGIKRKHKGAVITRFISILPLKFETAYFKLMKTKLQHTLKKQGQQLSSLIKDLELSLSIKGNNLQISKDWLKRIIERQLDRYLVFQLINIQKELEQVCLFLNPTDIIRMAMSSLNNSEVRSKSRWIQCFKLVKNTNRYLKEFLYDRPEFKNIQSKLTKIQASITTKIQTFLKDKIVKEVQPIIQEGQQMTQKENFDSTKIDYYQIQFGIDLIAYKKDEFEQGITGIIMCMSDLLSEMSQRGKFYEELNQHIIVKMKSKMFKMRQNIKSFIKSIIEPQVIGCPQRCPFCGIKCCKKGGHTDEHAAMKDTHLLQCFSGKVIHENGVCSRDICFTQSAILSGKVYVPETETIIPVLSYIEDKYTRWYDHFLDKSQYSNKRRQRQCNVIWANIQYVTIRYKYPYMIPDNSVKKYQYDPLQQEDIQAHKLEDY